MNRVEQTGRLARDVELKYTPNNKAVAQFTIAVRKSFIKEGDSETAYFFPVVIWGVHAENCKKYLHKGSRVGVTGELRSRSYEATDGTTKYITEIMADSVEFLDPRPTNNTEQGTEPPQDDYIPDETNIPPEREQSSLYDNDYINQISDDDLPF